MHDNIISHRTPLTSYTASRIHFCLGEPSPVLNLLLPLCSSSPQRCRYSASSSGHLLLKGQTSFLPLPPSPFWTSNLTEHSQPVKPAESLFSWFSQSMDHKKTGRRHQTSKGVPLAPPLASSHYNDFTALKNETKKMYFYIYLRY